MSIKKSPIPYKLYFTPNNNSTQNILKTTAQKLNLLESVGFHSENEMLHNFTAASVLAAVILEDNNVTLRFPNYFRTRPHKNYYRTQDFWLTRCSGILSDYLENEDLYSREGFLQLLYIVVKTQIEKENIEKFNTMPTQISSISHNIEPKMGCINDVSRKAVKPERFVKWSLYYFVYFVPFLNLMWVSMQY